MQLFDSGGRGAEYWDNAPDPFLATALITVGPHARTTRISFTPASGHLFRAEHVFLTIERQTAAAPVANVDVFLRLATLRNGTSDIFSDGFTDNTAFLRHSYGPFDLGIILDTDLLTIETVDASTGGTVFYGLYIKGIQFERQYAALVPQF